MSYWLSFCFNMITFGLLLQARGPLWIYVKSLQEPHHKVLNLFSIIGKPWITFPVSFYCGLRKHKVLTTKPPTSGSPEIQGVFILNIISSSQPFSAHCRVPNIFICSMMVNSNIHTHRELAYILGYIFQSSITWPGQHIIGQSLENTE